MQSEHKPGHSSFQVIEARVSRLDASPATPRRRWSAAAKERIVAEAMEPGANVSAVARSHGLSPRQVFTWRREAVRRARRDAEPSEAPSFAMVEVGGPETGGTVELMVGDVTMRIGATVPMARVKEILRAVRSA